jgi:RNA ligase (TIGR02306 family)
MTLLDAEESVPATTDRRLATIEAVTEIAAIPDADAIVRARIRGWDVVVKLGEFQPGDLCVYFEVDSLLDVADPRFEFLAPRGVRTDTEGRRGHVLKTARLRGQYSQGLAIPVREFPELGTVTTDRVGEDVTAALGVVKWDPPIPANLVGKVRGYRPSWIPSTDEERIQNWSSLLAVRNVTWVATEKIDGTSTTFWVAGDDFGVCTRNLDLAEDPAVTSWRIAGALDIHARLRAEWPDVPVALQGELYGWGIQKNPLQLKDQRFAAFTLRVDRVEVPRSAWPAWVQSLSVPVHNLPFPTSVEEALAQVERLTSAVSPGRAAEGIVWRAADTDIVVLPNGQMTRASFKVISNRYLMKNDR